jgi:catechol 2,3-dioxygenase-like lactoylglutathione lyase family enzyme
MDKEFSRVNGMQHIGIAVSDMEVMLPLYRKLFGLDIPFFDSVQPAPLMNVYTRNETITKRASMVLNLQGGCAVEVIQATSFLPIPNKNVFQWGDIGINAVVMKSRDVHFSHSVVQSLVSSCYSPAERPDGRPIFSMQDPDGNVFQFTSDEQWYSNSGHHSGGVQGCVMGVSNIDESMKLYADILGFDQVVYDETGVFEDWKELPGGNHRFRRVMIVPSKPAGGGFAKVTGRNHIELIQVLDRVPNKIFKGRIWGDLGIVHLGLDVKGMKRLGEQLSAKGFPFTCDSNSALSMGKTKVHCVYIDDPDGILIEMIEVFKVPIIEKWGIFLNVEKRDPLKPLPDFMLKALRFSRIKD